MSAAETRPPQLGLVIAELLAATEPVNHPSVESILAGTAALQYDWERLAHLGFTNPLMARQVRSILQIAQHLIDGDVSPEGVAPSLIAVGKIISSQIETVARIEAA